MEPSVISLRRAALKASQFLFCAAAIVFGLSLQGIARADTQTGTMYVLALAGAILQAIVLPAFFIVIALQLRAKANAVSAE